VGGHVSSEGTNRCCDKCGTAVRPAAKFCQSCGTKLGQTQGVPSSSPEHRVMQDYDEAIRLDPQNALAYFNRGNAYGAAGQYQQAIQDFDEAIRLNPKYAEAYYSRGLTYQKLGNYERANQDIDKAIDLDPSLKRP